MPRAALSPSLALIPSLAFTPGLVAQQPDGRESPLSEKLRKIATKATITVAHRGASALFPENTIPAFRAAVEAKAEMVELDFRQTKDGVLVCLHDGTLDRTTDSEQRFKKKKLRVGDCTLAQLRDLDAGTWKHKRFAGTRIPTLERALRTIQKGSITMIEHKTGDPRVLVALLRRMKLVDEVLVQSFDWKFLERVRKLEPRLTLAALGGSKKKPHPDGEVLKEIQRTGAIMVHWHAERLRPADVARLRAAGYLLVVFTVDKPKDYDKAIDLGVDAITTNFPTRLRNHLKQRRSSEKARDKRGPAGQRAGRNGK